MLLEAAVRLEIFIFVPLAVLSDRQVAGSRPPRGLRNVMDLGRGPAVSELEILYGKIDYRR